MNPAILNETVLVAKEFLDGELAKYETWEEFQRMVENNHSFKDAFKKSFTNKQTANANWTRIKKDGAGWENIKNFLGDNFREWQVKEALETLNNELIDRGKPDP